MRRAFRVLGVATVAAAPLTLGWSAAAGATVAGSAISATAAAASCQPHTTHKTTIVKDAQTRSDIYEPCSLNTKWSGPTVAPCTIAIAAFEVQNNTKFVQTMTLGGKAFATIGVGYIQSVCAWGTGKSTAVFGLSGSKATLTVNLS